MALIRSFRGIRPRTDLVKDIAALPYDVYNRDEAKEVVAKDKKSFLRIDRAETQFDDSVSTYDEKVYKKANELLWGMVEAGEFVQDNEDCYYIYTLEMNGRKQSGIVALASVDDYINNVIKKHENTRADKEKDRIDHIDTCGAQTGPIFLAYKEKKSINEIVKEELKKKPLYDFVSDDGIRHTVHMINNEYTIEEITEEFANVEALYIADGHHRAASAVKAGLLRREGKGRGKGIEGEYDYFLSVIFPDSELFIMDYNRVVHDLNGLTPEKALDEISKIYDIIKVSDVSGKPTKKGEVICYLNGKWYTLNVKDEFANDDPVKGLDVAVLQDNVLQPVFGIDDPKTNDRISFHGGIRGVDFLKTVADKTGGIAFAMYGVTMKELFDVADAGMLMPPKSTWFEPKLRSGLFIHEIDSHF